MKLTDRLKQYIDYKDISLNAFDRSIDAGIGYIGKQIAKKGSIGSDVLEKIFFTYPDLNPSWLLVEVGEMLKGQKTYADSHTDTGHFVDQTGSYEQIPLQLQAEKNGKNVTPTVTPTAKIASATASPTKLLAPQIITVDRHGNENIVYVPVRARAGYLTGYGDPDYLGQLESYRVPGFNNGTFRAFEVEGVSMWPTLENKEIVIGRWCEGVEYIREGRVHIIVTKNDGIVIKRCLNRVKEYGYVIAKSDAVEDRHLYENLNIRPEDIVEIWYAVMHMNPNLKEPADMYKRVNNLEADVNENKRLLKELMRRLDNPNL